MKALLASAILVSLLGASFIPPGGNANAKAADEAAVDQALLLELASARAKSGRVPRGYGSLGLTRDQKERIYGIQEVFAKRIDALEAELEKLKEEQSRQIKSVLNPVQLDQIERYEMAQRKTVE